jgi:hypothetical protein
MAMKEVYLVHIFLPEVFSAVFYELINRQRDRINELMESKVLLSYSLDMDRKNVWAFFEADNREELLKVLGSLPIISHVRYKVHELAYYNAAPASLPELIMN